MNATQIAITAVAILAMGGAAVGVFALKGDQQPQQTALAVPTATAPTASPPAAPTEAPSTATPDEAPSQALPDRTSCDDIRGTPYRSVTEREFYVANCVSQTAPVAQLPAASAPVVSTDDSESCETNVEITTTRSEETYDVAGANLDEVSDSLTANAPVIEGGTAYGLTEYSFGLDGSFCAAASACKLGEIEIAAEVVVTLPNLTTFDQLNSGEAEVWTDYAGAVAVHEGRHVRILEEGLDEIKRQLLVIDERPDCATLNHEIDKVWEQGGNQIENRQRAFHIADAQGNGGLVVQ